MKKAISLALSIIMILSIMTGLDFSVRADELLSSGSCGPSATYVFDSATGKITISGAGYIYSSFISQENTSIKYLVVNNGITSLGNWGNCKSLTSIDVPKSITGVYDSSFIGCPLSTVVYRGTAWEWDQIYKTSVEDSRMSKCHKVFCSVSKEGSCGADLTYSYTCTNSIGVLTISGTGEMTNYTDKSSNPFYNLCIDYLIIKSGVTSIGDAAFSYSSAIKSISIPNSVLSIGNNAFTFCTGLTKIEIPDSVTNIDRSAFSYCTCLTSVEIPNSVSSIGESAFYECSSLTSIELSNNLKIINNSTFYNCSGLKSVGIPNSITSIGSNAFYNCKNITSVFIPNSVTSIGGGAFSNCSGIKEITLPCSAKIGNSALTFYNCNNIEKVTLTKGSETTQTAMLNYSNSTGDSDTYYQYTPWYISRDNIKEIILESGITYIGTYAFQDCTGATSIELPSSLNNIASSAFGGNSNLERIKINDIASWCTRSFGNKFGKKYKLYLNNELVTDLKIPNSVKKISDYAFFNCTSLTSVEIPNSVNNIGDNAFAHCINLTSVTLPNSISSIGNYLFSGCTGLTSIEIPNSVSSVGEMAFYNCSSLTSINIPKSVTSIGISTFKDCPELMKIFVDDISCWASNSFGDKFPNKYLLYIGDELITDLDIPNSVTNIGESAFYNCQSINSVLIPSSVTSIGSNAFYNCQNITSVFIPNSVTSIGSSAFYKCLGLTSIEIPNSVTSIGSNAFKNCSGIELIELGEGIKSLSSDIFSGCSSIEKVYLYSKQIDSTQNLVSIMKKDSFLYAYAITDAPIYCSIYGINYKSLEGLECDLGHHNYDELIITEPKCVTKGLKKYQCKYCDYFYEESIPALGHTEIIDSAIAPTCTESGLTQGSHCSVCGNVLVDQDVVEANGHSYIDKITAPTCKDMGYTTHTCSACGDSYADSFTDITENHNYIGTVVNATCEQKGFTFYKCSVCGESYKSDYVEKTSNHFYSEKVTIPATCSKLGVKNFTCSVCGDSYTESIPMKAHTSRTDLAVAPTCTKSGFTQGSHCSVCGVILVAQDVVKAKGHNYKSIVTAATCYSKGYTTYTCSDCGDSYKDNYTELIPHTPKNAIHENEVLPTCATKGMHDNVVYCLVCNKELSRETVFVDKIAHTPKTDSAIAPKCEKTGLTKGSHCSICGEILIAQDVVKANGHSYETFITEPTCLSRGYTTYTCSVCGDCYNTDYIDTTDDHDYKSAVTTLPTCASEGERTYTCTICDNKYTESIAKKEHTLVTDKAIEATFKEAGKTEGKHCSVCGTVFVAQKSIAKLSVPLLSKVTAGSKQFKATWKSVKSIDGYQIQYSTSSGFKSGNKTVTVSGYKSTSKTVKSLKAKKKYYVRIRAYKTISGKKQYSTWSKSKTVTTKK